MNVVMQYHHKMLIMSRSYGVIIKTKPPFAEGVTSLARLGDYFIGSVTWRRRSRVSIKCDLVRSLSSLRETMSLMSFERSSVNLRRSSAGMISWISLMPWSSMRSVTCWTSCLLYCLRSSPSSMPESEFVILPLPTATDASLLGRAGSSASKLFNSLISES